MAGRDAQEPPPGTVAQGAMLDEGLIVATRGKTAALAGISERGARRDVFVVVSATGCPVSFRWD
jgi:hypothetical protein